mmetsp:Transcript_17358/g.59366  ORF Transcript_17358/g.59366 Transcript_17358/m.59366 type:complete len:288 (+) Transcript_17358:160-1023(+)
MCSDTCTSSPAATSGVGQMHPTWNLKPATLTRTEKGSMGLSHREQLPPGVRLWPTWHGVSSGSFAPPFRPWSVALWFCSTLRASFSSLTNSFQRCTAASSCLCIMRRMMPAIFSCLSASSAASASAAAFSAAILALRPAACFPHSRRHRYAVTPSWRSLKKASLRLSSKARSACAFQVWNTLFATSSVTAFSSACRTFLAALSRTILASSTWSSHDLKAASAEASTHRDAILRILAMSAVCSDHWLNAFFSHGLLMIAKACLSLRPGPAQPCCSTSRSSATVLRATR